jgi:hypothetical protein
LTDEQFYNKSATELDKMASQLQMAGLAKRPVKANGMASGLHHPFTR